MASPDQLADDLTAAILDANPVAATILGIRDREDRLPDFSEAGDETFGTRLRDIAKRAAALGPAPLAEQDQLTLAVVRAQTQIELDQLAVRAIEYTATDAFYAPAIG